MMFVRAAYSIFSLLRKSSTPHDRHRFLVHAIPQHTYLCRGRWHSFVGEYVYTAQGSTPTRGRVCYFVLRHLPEFP